MPKLLLHYGIVFVVFFAIDLFWLGIIAKNLYAKYLGYLMAPKVNWTAAVLFYLLFILGLLVFVIEPALIKQNLMELILTAALFGLVTYSTFDLTNLATVKDWPSLFTVVDVAWGLSRAVLVSTISYFILKLL